MISCSCPYAEGNNLIERGYDVKRVEVNALKKGLVLKKGRGLVPNSKRTVSFDRREVQVGWSGCVVVWIARVPSNGCHFLRKSQAKKCTALRIKPNVHYAPWVFIICQCRFITL